MKAKIWNNHWWIPECDPQTLYKTFFEILKKCEFTVLNDIEYYFKPFGYTAIFLIAESHLAIHTFPEEGKTYIELSSCNEEKSKTFEQWMIEEFPFV